MYVDITGKKYGFGNYLNAQSIIVSIYNPYLPEEKGLNRKYVTNCIYHQAVCVSLGKNLANGPELILG